MPSPTESPRLLTSLPSGRMAAAFSAIYAILKGDPDLIAANVTVTTYRHGLEETAKSKPEPDEHELPYIRLMFNDSPMKWETEREHLMDMGIAMVLFTRGPNELDMLNLMEATLHALYPQDATQRAAVELQLRGVQGLTTSRVTNGLGGMGHIGMSAHGLTSKFVVNFGLHVAS